jgi:AraC family transcriptional regulator
VIWVGYNHCTELKPMHTFGRVSRRYRASGYEFVISRYAKGARLPSHEHADGYICLNLGAEFLESTRSKESQYVRSHVAVTHPAGEVHRNTFGDHGGFCLSIFCEASSQSWASAIHTRGLCENTRSRETASMFDEQMKSANDFEQCTALTFLELTLRLLQDLSNDSRDVAHHRPIWRALEAVRDIPAHSWTLDELARIAQLHPTHLARQVRNVTGYTFGEHLRRSRVVAAVKLLKRYETDIASAAQACGFADQAHLTRMLRRYVGATPRMLRVRR